MVSSHAQRRGTDQLDALVSGETKRVRMAKRAQILLAAAGGETDERSRSPCRSEPRRFAEPSVAMWTRALHDRPRGGEARRLSTKQEVLLIETTCSPATERVRPLDRAIA